MKKLKEILVVGAIALSGILGLTGCAKEPVSPLFRWEDFVLDEPALTNIHSIQMWTLGNIKYQADIELGYREYWKPPMQTLNDKAGDCEDFAILNMAIAYKQMGIIPNLIHISNEIYPSHMMFEYDHKIYDVLGDGEYTNELNILKKINFWDVPYNMRKYK